jgi:hypothetical protein
MAAGLSVLMPLPVPGSLGIGPVAKLDSSREGLLDKEQ